MSEKEKQWKCPVCGDRWMNQPIEELSKFLDGTCDGGFGAACGCPVSRFELVDAKVDPTDKEPKKAAEGPFTVKDGLFRVDGGCVLLDRYNTLDCEGIAVAKDAEGNLIAWLKSPSGKRWMEENGVGGSK